MAHGDYCDYTNYVTRSVDLTSDVDALVDFVSDVPSTGGGDAPEVIIILFFIFFIFCVVGATKAERDCIEAGTGSCWD